MRSTHALRFVLVSAAATGLVCRCTLFTTLDGLDDGTRSDGGASADAASFDSAATIPDAKVDADAGATTVVVDAGLGDAAEAGEDGGCVDGEGCDIVTGVRGVAGIFVTGADLYYVVPSTNSIWMVPTTGGKSTRVDVAADKVNDPFDVVATPTALYWTEREPAFLAGRAIDGGTRTNFGTTGVPNMAYLAFDQGTLFASDDYPTHPNIGNVVCGNAPKNAAICAQVGTPISGVCALNGTLVFAEPTADKIVMSLEGAGSTSAVGYSLGMIAGVAMDSTDVYFLESQQVIARITLPMGIRRPVADLGVTVGEGDLAVDQTYVFVSEPVLGTIRRLPKPP